MNSWDIDFYAINQLRENCTNFFTLYEYPSCLIICSSFSFNDLWLFMVYRRFVLTPTNQKKTLIWMTLISVLCHVSTKISVFVLFGMLQAGFAQNIVARHFGFHRSHCWGVFDNLATLGTINMQVVHLWRHVSKTTT